MYIILNNQKIAQIAAGRRDAQAEGLALHVEEEPAAI